MYNDFSPSQFSKTNEIVLVPWHSQEGIRRLKRSKHKGSFYQLAHHFQPQINPLYCGIATSVIVLNALRAETGMIPSQKTLEVKLPKVWGGERIPFTSYSQATLLNAETEKIKPREIIELKKQEAGKGEFDPGLCLADLKGILQVYGLKVELHHADQRPARGVKSFRNMALKVINEIGKFLVVNFHGESMGATTGGHISPLAAYDTKSDSVLLMDVAGFENSWFWAPVEQLYRAMATLDDGVHRGWLVVSDKVK